MHSSTDSSSGSGRSRVGWTEICDELTIARWPRSGPLEQPPARRRDRVIAASGDESAAASATAGSASASAADAAAADATPADAAASAGSASADATPADATGSAAAADATGSAESASGGSAGSASAGSARPTSSGGSPWPTSFGRSARVTRSARPTSPGRSARPTRSTRPTSPGRSARPTRSARVTRSARPTSSRRSARVTGSAGVTGSARPTSSGRSARPTRSAGVVPLPATSMQWLRRYRLDRVIVAAVPVRVRTPSRVPQVARAPLREWPRLSLGLGGSAQSDQSQACGHHGRCCCKTCVLSHIPLLPRQAVHQVRRSREKAVRSAFDGNESPCRTEKYVAQPQSTFCCPCGTDLVLVVFCCPPWQFATHTPKGIIFSAYSYLPSRYHRRWR
jgi:hypothetical protein